MPEAVSWLIKRCAEWRPFIDEEIAKVPLNTRGIYVLLHHRPRLDKYNVLYIGMAHGSGGVRSRLKSHLSSTTKSKRCTHFSVYEVHPNITEHMIRELEGLFRHIFRKDRRANRLNIVKGYQPLRDVREDDFGKWSKSG